MSKKQLEAVPAKSENDYEAEDAARDLMRAEEHKQNDDLMKRVHKHISKKKKAINSIAGLKKKRDELIKEELGEDDEED